VCNAIEWIDDADSPAYGPNGAAQRDDEGDVVDASEDNEWYTRRGSSKMVNPRNCMRKQPRQGAAEAAKRGVKEERLGF